MIAMLTMRRPSSLIPHPKSPCMALPIPATRLSLFPPAAPNAPSFVNNSAAAFLIISPALPESEIRLPMVRNILSDMRAVW